MSNIIGAIRQFLLDHEITIGDCFGRDQEISSFDVVLENGFRVAIDSAEPICINEHTVNVYCYDKGQCFHVRYVDMSDPDSFDKILKLIRSASKLTNNM